MVFVIPGFFRKKEFYAYLISRFEGAGFEVGVADLGLNTANLKRSSEAVLEQLDNISDKVDVIAHSYGGIITKNLLFYYPETREKIRSIIFISVPHGGSWQGLFLSMFSADREVLPFSKNLGRLANAPLPEATVNFISEKELKVWPRKGGLLKNYIDIVIPDTNHDSIVNNDVFISKAIEFMKSNYDRIFLK